MSKPYDPQAYNSDLVQMCEVFLDRYYRDQIAKLAQRFPNEQESLFVDWTDLHQYNPDLADDFRYQPEEVRKHLEEALYLYDLPADINLQGANVRIQNVEPEVGIDQYRPDDLWTELTVSGQVSQVSQPQPKVELAVFECQRCGTIAEVPQPTGKMQQPQECSGCERQGPFQYLPEDSEFEQTQLARLQQPPEKAAGGEKFIDVRLSGDIAGTLPSGGGERVAFSGELAIDETDMEDTTFDYYLEGDAFEVRDGSFDDVDVSEYRETINEIREADDPIEVLVDSFAPQIARDSQLETIIEALILQMVGTNRKNPADGPTYRGDFHILLLGDPGTAKSELLQEVENLAPLAKFKSGKGVTKAGMIASAVADDFGGSKWTLKAGLMVLASGGIACLDEIDKVDENALDAAHSALENQRVSISKAGIDADLPAQTALLAAGNPKYGRFDVREPLAEQIDLPPSLMSRFDLMFMLRDEIDPARDIEVGEHIADSWAATGQKAAGENVEETVADRDIEEDAFTAYIAAARNEIDPVIYDEEVKTFAVQKYSELRHANGYDEEATIPVTPRKQEALFRLAEASARARFSRTVEREDVERAYRLVERSMKDVGYDPESGEMDVDILETGTSTAQRERMKRVKAIINELATPETSAKIDEVVEMAVDELDADEKTIRDSIDHLKEKGEVYEATLDRLRST